MFHRLNAFLKIFQMIAYEATNKSILQPIDNKINRSLKIIFCRRKLDSNPNFFQKTQIYNNLQQHTYEQRKELMKILRNWCKTKHLQKCSNENILEKIAWTNE